ncbi:hypothetical protein N9V25_04445, partial [Flavobacteriaceae bacterium]|nr:hypothetical protein [Flavobacteriaceae bacterium]
NNPQNIELINQLLSFGLNFVKETIERNSHEAFEGKRFVVSGVFQNYSREDLKKEIEMLGGSVVSSVSAKTDFIVAGEGMGPSKKQKAESLKIPILNEEAFNSLKKINRSKCYIYNKNLNIY